MPERNDQMTQFPGLKCRNYPVICPLVSKLPWSFHRKWDERVQEYARYDYDLYPNFQVLTEEV